MGRLLRSAVGFGLAFVVAMVLLELLVRFSGTSGPTIIVDDPSFGRLMKPNLEVVSINEGFKLGRINRYGYLGKGYPFEKPPQTIRIALMGDSYVAANQLFDRHHFRTLMEENLNSVSPREVQVLNFGFPAVDFEQMYIYYEVFARKFSPDFVLYFIGTNSLNTGADEIGPRLKLDADSLRIDYAFRSSPGFARSRKLSPVREIALYPLVSKAKEMHARGATMDVIFDKFYRLFAAEAGEQADKEPVENPKRMPLNRAVIGELGRTNREGTVTSIIVVRDELPATFVDFLKENGVPILNPAPRLASLAEQGINPRYWPGSRRTGHWNPRAHRVIADFLAEELLPLLP